MTNADMMIVFDVIMLILGGYIVMAVIKMKKEKSVPSLFVASEEMIRCKNAEGFAAYLYPRGLVFGLVSILFGVEGICNDLIFSLGQVVNVIMILLFIAVWVWFSAQLRKGKERFF